MKWLSNLNIILGALLLVFMLIFGDLKFIFESYTLAIGDYIRHFVEYSLRIDPYTNNNAWIQQWTVFYWAWVISWSPFIEVSWHVYHAVAPFENLLCVCL